MTAEALHGRPFSRTAAKLAGRRTGQGGPAPWGTALVAAMTVAVVAGGSVAATQHAVSGQVSAVDRQLREQRQLTTQLRGDLARVNTELRAQRQAQAAAAAAAAAAATDATAAASATATRQNAALLAQLTKLRQAAADQQAATDQLRRSLPTR